MKISKQIHYWVKLTVLPLLFSLTGCGWAPMDLAKARFVCQNNEGVYSMGYLRNEFTITCNDGKIFAFPNMEDFYTLHHPDIAKHLKEIQNEQK